MPEAARRSAAAARPLILGIDPGLLRTGYAILCGDAPLTLVEAGVVRLERAAPLEYRLSELQAALEEIVDTHRPATLACEQLYAHYKHPRTAILMGHARGVILALAARRGLHVIHVGATHVKKLLTGRGHAGKHQMQRAVALTLGLTQLPEPHDVADAIAIALCGLRSGAAPARRVRVRRARLAGGRA